MGRDIQIVGPVMASVIGGSHMSGTIYGKLSQLGMSVGQITISPQFKQRGIKVDDFGSEVPAEVQFLMSEVNISVQLVQYDREVLDAVMQESQGGGGGFADAGTLAPAGTLLGNGRAVLTSGNHYTRLNLVTLTPAPAGWRFRSTYLNDSVEIPIGTERTIAVLNFKAIPYAFPNFSGEISSSGIILWDHNTDTP